MLNYYTLSSVRFRFTCTVTSANIKYQILKKPTVLHRDTIVSQLPARQSKLPMRPSWPTGAAIVTYWRGHRDLPERQFIIIGATLIVTGAACENLKQSATQIQYKYPVWISDQYLF